jgi:hypothetical protein
MLVDFVCSVRQSTIAKLPCLSDTFPLTHKYRFPLIPGLRSGAGRSLRQRHLPISMADAKPSSSDPDEKAAAAAAPAAGIGIGGMFERITPVLRLILATSLVCAVIVQSRTILTNAYSIRLHAIENYGFGE